MTNYKFWGYLSIELLLNFSIVIVLTCLAFLIFDICIVGEYSQVTVLLCAQYFYEYWEMFIYSLVLQFVGTILLKSTRFSMLSVLIGWSFYLLMSALLQQEMEFIFIVVLLLDLFVRFLVRALYLDKVLHAGQYRH